MLRIKGSNDNEKKKKNMLFMEGAMQVEEGRWKVGASVNISPVLLIRHLNNKDGELW